MNTILFGRVPAENAAYTDGYFTDNKGNPFYFQAVLDEDEVYLEDTCGRFLPLDVETLKDAALALTMLAKLAEAEVAAVAAYEETLESYNAEVAHIVADWNLIRS